MSSHLRRFFYCPYVHLHYSLTLNQRRRRRGLGLPVEQRRRMDGLRGSVGLRSMCHDQAQPCQRATMIVLSDPSVHNTHSLADLRLISVRLQREGPLLTSSRSPPCPSICCVARRLQSRFVHRKRVSDKNRRDREWNSFPHSGRTRVRI